MAAFRRRATLNTTGIILLIMMTMFVKEAKSVESFLKLKGSGSTKPTQDLDASQLGGPDLRRSTARSSASKGKEENAESVQSSEEDAPKIKQEKKEEENTEEEKDKDKEDDRENRNSEGTSDPEARLELALEEQKRRKKKKKDKKKKRASKVKKEKETDEDEPSHDSSSDECKDVRAWVREVEHKAEEEMGNLHSRVNLHDDHFVHVDARLERLERREASVKVSIAGWHGKREAAMEIEEACNIRDDVVGELMAAAGIRSHVQNMSHRTATGSMSAKSVVQMTAPWAAKKFVDWMGGSQSKTRSFYKYITARLERTEAERQREYPLKVAISTVMAHYYEGLELFIDWKNRALRTLQQGHSPVLIVEESEQTGYSKFEYHILLEETIFRPEDNEIFKQRFRDCWAKQIKDVTLSEYRFRIHIHYQDSESLAQASQGWANPRVIKRINNTPKPESTYDTYQREKKEGDFNPQEGTGNGNRGEKGNLGGGWPPMPPNMQHSNPEGKGGAAADGEWEDGGTWDGWPRKKYYNEDKATWYNKRGEESAWEEYDYDSWNRNWHSRKGGKHGKGRGKDWGKHNQGSEDENYAYAYAWPSHNHNYGKGGGYHNYSYPSYSSQKGKYSGGKGYGKGKGKGHGKDQGHNGKWGKKGGKRTHDETLDNAAEEEEAQEDWTQWKQRKQKRNVWEGATENERLAYGSESGFWH
eukprot:TRINITY_DN23485_c1_g1_i2.p1 TRINITY_DN23485_c1_g1~~TRINITY_DN23485_c1_g1_i2.p1  ORF type:complete len:700 (-),score=196.81 TRINITY_DN23485_c1_g1_i2:257-2356(-)